MKKTFKLQSMMTAGLIFLATFASGNSPQSVEQQLNDVYQKAIEQVMAERDIKDKDSLLTEINARQSSLNAQVKATYGNKNNGSSAQLAQKIKALAAPTQWFGLEDGVEKIKLTKDTMKAMKTAPVVSDSSPTVGVQSDDPRIIAQALALENNPAKIFHWVNQTIDYTPSYGQIQGAVGTLLSETGNDTDTASLLIALLRAAGVPARFVTADVVISAETLKKHLGDLTEIDQALSLLDQGGIPFDSVVQGGQVSAVKIRRTWVEAWVNLLPAGGFQLGASADNWVSLDPAYKLYQYTDGMTWLSDLSFQSAQYGQAVNNAVTTDTDEIISAMDLAALDAINTELAAAVTESPMPSIGTAFGSTELNLPNARLLPASLPYAIDALVARDAQINTQHQLMLQVTSDAQSTDMVFDQTANTAELAGGYWYIKSIPASASDTSTLAAALGGAEQLDQLPTNIESHQIAVKMQLWS